VLLLKFHLHDVAWNERCLISLLAEERPVNSSKPRMLHDFSDALRSLSRVLGKEARN